MAGTNPTADDDDWSVACSDDEKYNITPKDMIKLFQKAARKEKFELEWKCPGRRPPTPEHQLERMEIKEEMEQDPMPEHRTVPVAFDFNSEPSSELSHITPRHRTPGSTKTPRSNQKRVARLDKIMDDMIRHRKMDEEAVMSERSSTPHHQQQQQQNK